MIGTAFDCLAVDSLLLTTEVNESVRIDMTANNLRHTILKILLPPLGARLSPIRLSHEFWPTFIIMLKYFVTLMLTSALVVTHFLLMNS